MDALSRRYGRLPHEIAELGVREFSMAVHAMKISRDEKEADMRKLENSLIRAKADPTPSFLDRKSVV